MIFHDQNNSIVDNVNKLDEELSNLGFSDHVVHTEPLADLLKREVKKWLP